MEKILKFDVDNNKNEAVPVNSEKSKNKTGDWWGLTPFEHIWTYSHKISIPIKNLTNEYYRILYTESNKVVIYDYERKEMKLLEGHLNKVVFLSTDSTGRWILTADSGIKNTIVIWDASTRIPVRCLFEKYSEKCNLIVLSPCGKFLLIVYGENPLFLDLWEWANGYEVCDASTMIPQGMDSKSYISFCSFDTKYFVITSSTGILFCCYKNGRISTFPSINSSESFLNKFGTFIGTVYITGTQNAVSASDKGKAILWNNENILLNIQVSKKKYEKEIFSLQSEPIELLHTVDEFVITANSKGSIIFYDKCLKLLFWYNTPQLQNMVDVCFHLRPRTNHSTAQSYINGIDEHKNNKPELSGPREWESIYKEVHDATLEGKPFVVRDCIASTSDGKIYYVNFSRNNVENILPSFSGSITAIDAYPSGKFICLGTDNGYLHFIEYEQNKNRPDLKKLKTCSISYLKYCPNLIYLACGQDDGSLWLVRPLTLIVLHESPYNYSSKKIFKIEFSLDSQFMATADEDNSINLYFLRNSVNFLGKYQGHSKKMNDFLFVPDRNLLISVGSDRNLVEYGFNKRNEKQINIKSITRIDQSAIPLALMLHPEMKEVVIISSSEYKYKIIQLASKKCIKTIQAPLLNDPVNCLMAIPGTKNFLVYTAGNQVGLQKLPLDGNPFKYMSVTTSSCPVIRVCFANSRNYMFTLTGNGESFSVWRYHSSAVNMLESLGGSGLDPYYCLLEGGKDGDLLNEIKDLFINCQIIHDGEFFSQERFLSYFLPLCELVDLIRTLGYYPSNYEIENMMNELKFSKENYTKDCKISFEEFLKLFINHRHVLIFNEDILKDAFCTFIATNERNNNILSIKTSHFINVIEEIGERFTRDETIKSLRSLIPQQSKDDDGTRLNFLPERISFSFFNEYVLGRKFDNIKT